MNCLMSLNSNQATQMILYGIEINPPSSALYFDPCLAMCGLVKSQITLLYCLVVAQTAFQHVRPCVRFLVHFQVVFQRECQMAIAALPSFDPSVNQLVPGQLGILLEHRFTSGEVASVAATIVGLHVS